MFRKVLNKRKRGSTKAAHALTDKAAMKIAVAINRMQNGFANFLNKRTNHLSGRTWKILIVVFGICWGLFSMYVFASALLPSTEKSIGSIRKVVPQHLTATPKQKDSLEWMEKIYDIRKSVKK